MCTLAPMYAIIVSDQEAGSVLHRREPPTGEKPGNRQPVELKKGAYTMTIEEMKEYIAAELEEEHKRLLAGEENHYGYLFMIANDMGLTK